MIKGKEIYDLYQNKIKKRERNYSFLSMVEKNEPTTIINNE
jgi:hypothetical protein